MEFSRAGLIGVLVGLLLAAIEYYAVIYAARQSKPEPDEAQLARLRMIVLPSFVVLPAVFYFLGEILAEQLK